MVMREGARTQGQWRMSRVHHASNKAGPARPVRPVRFWPYHFSVA